MFFFFFQAEDGIRDVAVTGVQTCALPICATRNRRTAFLSATHRRRSRRSLSWYSLRKGADWMLPPSRSRFSVRLRKAEARSEARAPFDLVLGYLAGLAVAGAGFARAPIHAPSANGINCQS